MKFLYNDYELIYLIKRGSDEALDILIKKYQPLAISFVNKFDFNYQLKEDVVQECLLELYYAIYKFEQKYNTSFFTYIHLIFKRKIIRNLEYKIRDKEVVYEFCDVAKRILEEECTRYDEDIKLVCLERNLENFKINLSEFQLFVLKYVMLMKRNPRYVAKEYQIDEKKIYNAIQVIRMKYKMYFGYDF